MRSGCDINWLGEFMLQALTYSSSNKKDVKWELLSERKLEVRIMKMSDKCLEDFRFLQLYSDFKYHLGLICRCCLRCSLHKILVKY